MAAAAVRFDPLVVQQASKNASTLKLTMVPKEEVDQALEKKDESIVRLREENKDLIARGPKDAAIFLGLGAIAGGGFSYANGRWGGAEGVAKFGTVPVDITAGAVLAAIGLGVPNRSRSKTRDYVKEACLGVGFGGIGTFLSRYATHYGAQHAAAEGSEHLPLPKQMQGATAPQQLGPGQPGASAWDGQNLYVQEPTK